MHEHPTHNNICSFHFSSLFLERGEGGAGVFKSSYTFSRFLFGVMELG